MFCRHRQRDTYEIPGGHREKGENILETARRELREETGAIKFQIKPVCVYSVTGKNSINMTGEETYGLLCFAEIMEFADKLEKATLKTIEDGKMTKDLALITSLENVKVLNSQDFIKAIRETMEAL